MMHTFTGFRPSPPEEYKEKGITNAGESPDYEGVLFTDGTVVIRWMTTYKSHSVWASWSDFYQVHGHPEYGTRIHYHEFPPPPHEFVDSGHMFSENADRCRNCGLDSFDSVHNTP